MPESRADSALTAPTISPVSPWTSEVQVTSPSILPSNIYDQGDFKVGSYRRVRLYT